ncbi:MAG: cobalamin-binding protein [Elusimicrobiota bacterium]
MRQLKITIACLILPLLFCSSALAYDRIISIIPSATKSIYLMGLEDKLVAVTVYCPPEASEKEKIGTVLEPDLEKIVSLEPDLVIATKEGNRHQTVEKLQSLGIKVYVMDSVNNFEEICGAFIKLGRFLGADNSAGKVVRGARKRIEKVRSVKRNSKPAVFCEIGARPLFTASGGSFINDIIEFAGAANIFKDLKPRYPQISREEVLKRDPDAIVIITMGDVTDKEKEAWNEFPGLKAARSGRIYVLSEAVFTDPTPSGLADGVEILAQTLFGKSRDRKQ